MSKIMVPQYVDDLSGERLGEHGTTIAFAFQGHAYEIDLSADNAKKMTDALGMYIDHARKATTGRGRRASGMGGSSGGSSEETKAARAWLIEQGILSRESRGRISAENMEKYHNRGQLSMVPVEPAKADEAKVNGTAKPDEQRSSAGNSPAPAKKAAKASGTPAGAST